MDTPTEFNNNTKLSRVPYVYIPTSPLSNVLQVYSHPQGYGNREGTIPTSCLSIMSHVDIPSDMEKGQALFPLHV